MKDVFHVGDRVYVKSLRTVGEVTCVCVDYMFSRTTAGASPSFTKRHVARREYSVSGIDAHTGADDLVLIEGGNNRAIAEDFEGRI